MCESPVICDLDLFKLQMGLFGIIKQICHASVGNMMECFPSGGWFSRGRSPRENHPPEGKHTIILPSLSWHICIMLETLVLISPVQYFPGQIKKARYSTQVDDLKIGQCNNLQNICRRDLSEISNNYKHSS